MHSDPFPLSSHPESHYCSRCGKPLWEICSLCGSQGWRRTHHTCTPPASRFPPSRWDSGLLSRRDTDIGSWSRIAMSDDLFPFSSRVKQKPHPDPEYRYCSRCGKPLWNICSSCGGQGWRRVHHVCMSTYRFSLDKWGSTILSGQGIDIASWSETKSKRSENGKEESGPSCLVLLMIVLIAFVCWALYNWAVP